MTGEYVIFREWKRRVATACFLFLLIMAVSGCNRGDGPESRKKQVIPKDAVSLVGDDSITAGELRWYLDSRSSGSTAATADEQVRARLEELITVKMLALEARKKKLDKDPALQFAIEQMLGQKLLEKEVILPARKRMITQEEIESYYNAHRSDYVQSRKVRLADIFIAGPEYAPAIREEKRQEAEKILARALQDQDERFGFSRLVEKYSDEHPSYPKGDTGYFDAKGGSQGIAQTLVDQAFSLTEKGKVFEELVATPIGFHIVMLIADRSPETKTVDDVAAQIEQRIRRDEMTVQRKGYMNSLVSNHSRKLFEDELKKVIKEHVAANKDTKQNDAGPPVLKSK